MTRLHDDLLGPLDAFISSTGEDLTRPEAIRRILRDTLTGDGTLVQVRLKPELLRALDQFVQEAGSSRPDVLRHAFALWAEAHGYLQPKDRVPERPVMLSMPKSVLAQLDEISGGKPYDEVIDLAVSEWIDQVKREEAGD